MRTLLYTFINIHNKEAHIVIFGQQLCRVFDNAPVVQVGIVVQQAQREPQSPSARPASPDYRMDPGLTWRIQQVYERFGEPVQPSSTVTRNPMPPPPLLTSLFMLHGMGCESFLCFDRQVLNAPIPSPGV